MFQLLLHIFRQHIRFQVNWIARLQLAQRCDLEGVRNQGHTESLFVDIHQRKADTVNSDRSLAGHLAGKPRRHLKQACRPVSIVDTFLKGPHRIYVTGHKMPAQAI